MPSPTAPRSLGLLAGLLVSVLLASACTTTERITTLVERRDVQVIGREYRRGFSTVEQGFEHPVKISASRLQHILGAIDVRGRENEDVAAALRTVLDPTRLPGTAIAMSEAFSRLGPNQVMAVRVITKRAQHGIFNKKYLTTFVSWVKDGLLHFYFSRVDWEVPDRNRKTELPMARLGDRHMRFKVVPFGRQAMFTEGAYALSVDWQDPVFRRPLRVAKDTRRVRTILMEEEVPEARRAPKIEGDVLQHLSAADLRALADLEEARQKGELTESQYRRKRRELLAEAEKAAKGGSSR